MASRAPARIRFKAGLLRPAKPAGADWAFLVLPQAASGNLPTRSQVWVEGTFGAAPFQATLEPDGQGGHWLKVEKRLLDAAGVVAGDTVALDIAPVAEEPEPVVPPDLREALDANPDAKATWDDITPVARRDWIQWMTSGKKEETRVKRIATGCDMLASGKRGPAVSTAPGCTAVAASVRPRPPGRHHDARGAERERPRGATH